MHRIIVDLPDPDGPQTTTFSPVLTVKLMSCRTWAAPNHLSTAVNSMHTSAVESLGATGDVSTTLVLRIALIRPLRPSLLATTRERGGGQPAEAAWAEGFQEWTLAARH